MPNGCLAPPLTAVKLYNFTRSLDILLGREALANTRLQTSPFAAAYQGGTPAVEYGFMTQLLRLREVVLTNRPATAGLGELLSVAAEYRRSGLYLTSNNPILQGSAAGVAVMTAHGAKGREFEHVFILSCIDEVWGNRARSNNQRIRLPENLPLYPAGDTESDRLRLLYVAMTRANLT